MAQLFLIIIIIIIIDEQKASRVFMRMDLATFDYWLTQSTTAGKRQRHFFLFRVVE